MLSSKFAFYEDTSKGNKPPRHSIARNGIPRKSKSFACKLFSQEGKKKETNFSFFVESRFTRWFKLSAYRCFFLCQESSKPFILSFSASPRIWILNLTPGNWWSDDFSKLHEEMVFSPSFWITSSCFYLLFDFSGNFFFSICSFLHSYWWMLSALFLF